MIAFIVNLNSSNQDVEIMEKVERIVLINEIFAMCMAFYLYPKYLLISFVSVVVFPVL